VKHPFRRKHLSPRLLPFYVLAIAAFVFARPSAARFAVGLALIVAGLGLRAWGAGHLVKTDRLTISGPYAHLRHPLYAGTLLVGVGFALVAGGVALSLGLVLGLPAFFLYYLPYKERIESARLERRYGADYAAYRATVPAILPRWSAWRPPAALASDHRSSWSLDRFVGNSEHATLVGVGVGVLLLSLRPVLWP
jgi:protein-S-isoprenylcysteine O-methyltransferase Ste14